MLQKLLVHSTDLAALQKDGYEMQVRGGYLIIHHVPYVNDKKEVKFGILVSELNLLNNEQTTRPSSHTVHFSGEPPCDINGVRINGIYHSLMEQEILPGLTVHHYFSNKPPEGYADYYEKISTYVRIIQAPAQALNPQVTALTFRVYPDEESAVFRYVNTNSSRAKITNLDQLFAGQRVAIIGMGGTGAYILDALSKCEIPEIHLFDRDLFHQHNAFRCPGAATEEILGEVLYKVDYYARMYGAIHKGIVPHVQFITTENVADLSGMTQIFVAIDKPEVKKFLYPDLMKKEMSFIDVGMGLHVANGQIVGTLRVTDAGPGNYEHLANRISMAEDQDNDYNANIQIAELNSLNANLAVIRWKKMLGFYADQMHEHNLSYNIDTSQLTDDDHTA